MLSMQSQHHFSNVFGAAENTVGGFHFLDRKHCMDVRNQLAGSEQREQFVMQGMHDPALFLGSPAPQRAADQTDPFAPDRFQIDHGFRARHGGDHDPASAEHHVLETFSHQFAADAVQCDRGWRGLAPADGWEWVEWVAVFSAAVSLRTPSREKRII